MRIPDPSRPVADVAAEIAPAYAEAPFDGCLAASAALWSALREAGHDARPIQVAGLRRPAPDADPRWLKLPQSAWTHYLVEVDGQVYDLTRRQFDPGAECPHVCDRAALAAEWDRVYADADAPDFSYVTASPPSTGRRGGAALRRRARGDSVRA